MILYVNDNEGILFLRNVEVEVQPKPPTPGAGRTSAGGFFPGSYSFEESLRIKDDTRRAKQEEEELLLMRIFSKACLDL